MICDNTVVGLEHFKIDSSETNRKGSTYNIPNINQFIMIKDGNLLNYKVNDLYVFNSEELEIQDFEQPMMTSVSFTISKNI